MPKVKINWASLLVAYRAEKKLSQDELAAEIGISGGALSKIESGINMPKRTTQYLIRKILKIKN